MNVTDVPAYLKEHLVQRVPSRQTRSAASPLLSVPRLTTDFFRLAVWLSGNALTSINVVALRQTRLVLGWVTVCGRVNHLGM